MGELQAEDRGDGLAEISEGAPRAEIDAGAEAGAAAEDGDVLPGVIGVRAVGGVAAVIGGDEEEPALAEGSQEIGDRGVGLQERLGVALWVSAVAEEHVEIDQVREDEAAVEGADLIEGLLEPVGVALGVDAPRDAALGEDVADLAHADDGDVGLGEDIAQGRAPGLHGEIAAVVGAPEGARGAHEGARDDAHRCSG